MNTTNSAGPATNSAIVSGIFLIMTNSRQYVLTAIYAMLFGGKKTESLIIYSKK